MIGFFSLLAIKFRQPLEIATKEIENLDRKIAEIERSRSELEKLGDYLKNPAYLERQARLKLNYKKPDENVVFIYKNQYNQDRIASPSFVEDPKPLANWQKWLEYLLNRQ